MATHSSTLVWKIPWTEEPSRLQSMGSLRVRYDLASSLSLFTCMHWRRKWQPTPVFLPGESQGRGSLVGCRLWGRTELDMTEATQQQQDLFKQFFCVFLLPLLNLFCFSQAHSISFLYCACLCMKCSLSMSHFLEEISKSFPFYWFPLFLCFIQIPCEYTLEVTNRFKGQIWHTEYQKTYGWRFLTLYRRW